MIVESNSSGIDVLRRRINACQNTLPSLLLTASKNAGNTMKTRLSAASPRGQSGGGPPPGDSSGPLAESFYVDAASQGDNAHMELKTHQPTKIKYVVEGRGEVLPVMKKALFWKGLRHPVKRAKPSKANDFVTPTLSRRNEVVETEMVKVIDELNGIMSK